MRDKWQPGQKLPNMDGYRDYRDNRDGFLKGSLKSSPKILEILAADSHNARTIPIVARNIDRPLNWGSVPKVSVLICCVISKWRANNYRLLAQARGLSPGLHRQSWGAAMQSGFLRVIQGRREFATSCGRMQL